MPDEEGDRIPGEVMEVGAVITPDGTFRGILMEDDKVLIIRTPEQVEQEMINNSFLGDLYRLMHKADSRNWRILRNAYPIEAREYLGWFHRDRG